jgi:hypothetical protein
MLSPRRANTYFQLPAFLFVLQVHPILRPIGYKTNQRFYGLSPLRNQNSKKRKSDPNAKGNCTGGQGTLLRGAIFFLVPGMKHLS